MPKLSRMLQTALYVFRVSMPITARAPTTWAATAACFYSHRAGPCGRSLDVTMAIIQRRCQQAGAYIKETVLPE